MEMAVGIGVPLAVIVVFYLLKANAAVLFFVICACGLMFERGTNDVETIIGSVVPGVASVQSFAVPVLLVLPLVIGLLVQSRYSKKWLLVQLLPSIAAGLLLYITLVRVMIYLYDVDWRSGAVWTIASKHQTLLIALGTFASLMALPLAGKGGGHEGKHHGKH